jgi:hypothetical protein
MSVDWGSRFSAPEVYRLQAYDQLVRALLQLEKHSDAVRAAQECAAAFPNEPAVAYDAARFIARSMPIAEKDSTLGPHERTVIAQEYGRLAVQHLRHAIHLGYHDVNQMKAEPDLDPLRARQDYRELLAELGTTR